MRYRRFGACAAAIAAYVTLSACADVDGAFQSARDDVGGFFASMKSAVTGTSDEAGGGQAAYEAGLAARARGDDAAALKHFRTAAARGDRGGRYEMGRAYYNGEGVGRDYDKAIALLQDSALAGHGEAQYLMGEAYSNGRGVPSNATVAVLWYGKAAARGVTEAQYAAGVSHATGLGVPADRTLGYTWLTLAEGDGHTKAGTVRRAIEARMTAAQVREAKRTAKRFRPVADETFADTATVMYVQQSLQALGYDAGPADGQLGPRTRSAVVKYWQKRALPGEAAVSPALVERLIADNGSAS